MTIIDSGILGQHYPAALFDFLASLHGRGIPSFLTGGAVRDLLRGQLPLDMDITVPGHGVSLARELAASSGGAFVLLDEDEGVARVVINGAVVDFSSFREQTSTLEDDLALRDFTINAMALPFEPDLGGFAGMEGLVDPHGGREDLSDGLLRPTSESVFQQDPLRMLRAYRFMACLEMEPAPGLTESVQRLGELISSCAGERLSQELEKLMWSERAHNCCQRMAASGLLFHIFPELGEGRGQKQPGAHHLDVFHHNLECLARMEELIAAPFVSFAEYGGLMTDYLAEGRRSLRLKWAALFHDLGKPHCLGSKEGRITFYNHDHAGAGLFETIGRRLRWSKADITMISRLIAHHMWPFHLNNARMKTGIKPKACLKLAKAIGDELNGLFLLAMADSLASQGEGKPEDMESNLLALFDQVARTIEARVRPVLESPPLLNGRDLINELGLQPGPLFGVILRGVQQEQVSRPGMTRCQALAWVRNSLAFKKI